MVKCCKCIKPAFYFRKQEGNNYCQGCFSKQIEKTFKRNMRKVGLKKDDQIYIVNGFAKNVLARLLKDHIKFISSKQSRTGKHISPTTLDEEIQAQLKQLLFGHIKKTVHQYKPLSNIYRKEIVLYAKINKIKLPNKKNYNKKNLEIEKIIEDLELKRSGTASQIGSYFEKIGLS